MFLKILDVSFKCGTEYSGFKSVDLQKWSLKLAAGKYKIKGEVNPHVLANGAKWGGACITYYARAPLVRYM